MLGRCAPDGLERNPLVKGGQDSSMLNSQGQQIAIRDLSMTQHMFPDDSLGTDERDIIGPPFAVSPRADVP